ncbi:hypothetical protein E3N88_16048 [Mikania micrantha]|uniref:Uncharacterized protein n=1 Tax=Mikania micrantha TaxID=192012 RepID=A0A5N6NYL2_9ASTR|nr:hypothetical protein E3N88_16048 [Mikania micrantha]
MRDEQGRKVDPRRQRKGNHKNPRANTQTDDGARNLKGTTSRTQIKEETEERRHVGGGAAVTQSMDNNNRGRAASEGETWGEEHRLWFLSKIRNMQEKSGIRVQ